MEEKKEEKNIKFDGEIESLTIKQYIDINSDETITHTFNSKEEFDNFLKTAPKPILIDRMIRPKIRYRVEYQ